MTQLTVAAKAPFIPYPVLIAADLINNSDVKGTVNVEFVDDKAVDGKSVRLSVGDATYTDQLDILNYLADQYPSVIGGKTESQEWAQFAFAKLTSKNFKEVTVDLEKLDAHLNFRSVVVGYAYSLADIAIWGTLRANIVLTGAIKNEVCINVSRWYNFLSADKKFEGVYESTFKAISELKKAAKGGKKEAHKANFEIGLPNAKVGEVVTRFPPEPSGYLHIGHAKAAILNEYFARAYKGKLIIRFDDTNPSKEKEEFQDSIIEDLALLGIKGDRITYSSNYFNEMFDLAVQMIKDGLAYVDDTPLETMREQRMVGEPSARRDRSVEENLKLFTEDMKNGTEEGLKSCLRAKIDYKALNKTLRDPVLYRTNLTPHHRTGTAWKMYPTYDFCMPVVDSIEGVTHALRTNEYRDRNAQYEWISKALKLRHVDIWDFGRVNFVRTLLSKRKLQWFVDKQYVPNWDDPRFPTVRGVRRRGMTVEGLRNFIISQGPSRNIINLDWSIIWALNKKVIDPVAPRHTAVDFKNVVPVKLSNGPASPVTEDKPKHKKNTELGTKKVIFANEILVDQDDAATFAENEEITFMDWGNAIIKTIHKDGDVVTSIDAELHLEGDFRKTSKKVTWLANTDDKVKVEFVDFDHLITKDKLEEGDNFEDFLTPQTEFHSHALADANVKQLKEGDIIQFERKGYFRLDKPYGPNQEPVFFTIPDGKTVQRYGAKK